MGRQDAWVGKSGAVLAHGHGAPYQRKMDHIKPKQVQQLTQSRLFAPNRSQSHLKIWRGGDLPNMKITKRTQF
jgi:hypothetical protein